jgi:hypothetical protein
MPKIAPADAIVEADKSVMDIFREGFALGYPRSRNPYKTGTMNLQFWRQGWAWIDLPIRQAPRP